MRGLLRRLMLVSAVMAVLPAAQFTSVVESPEANSDSLEANLATLKRTRAFPGCYLKGANLRGADLYGAKLYGVKLQVADLQGANLREAGLRADKGISRPRSRKRGCLRPLYSRKRTFGRLSRYVS